MSNCYGVSGLINDWLYCSHQDLIGGITKETRPQENFKGFRPYIEFVTNGIKEVYDKTNIKSDIYRHTTRNLFYYILRMALFRKMEVFICHYPRSNTFKIVRGFPYRDEKYSLFPTHTKI